MTAISERAAACAPSPTLAITARARALAAQGVDVIGFGAGEPDFDTPDHIKEAAIAALKAGQTKYTPSAGTMQLREAICGKLDRENGLQYEPADIIVSAGAKHSIYNLFQALLNQGDEVLIPRPYWVSYPEQVKLAQGVPVFVDAPEENGFRVTADALEAACTPRTRIMVLNSPSNPSGAVVEESELRRIAELAVRRNLLVLSDEIYEHLTYGRAHHTIAGFGEEIRRRTFIVNGFSKAYSMTGWRLGWLAGDRTVVSPMTRIQDQSTSNPTSFAQAGGIAALTGPQECVAEMRRAFEQRREVIVERLNGMDGVSCVRPDGAFYVLPNFSGLMGRDAPDSDALCEHLLTEHGLAAVPGSGFGMPRHIRFSYATGMDAIEKGMARLAAAVTELAAARS